LKEKKERAREKMRFFLRERERDGWEKNWMAPAPPSLLHRNILINNKRIWDFFN
jgi:hypothetical protein